MSKGLGCLPPQAAKPLSELIEACRINDVTALDSILALGADPNTQSPLGTPLVVAAENASVTAVRHLLQAGAQPNLAGSNGNTPLRAAIVSGDGDCIAELLSAGADVNQETARGTPLSVAAAAGDCETLALLLDRGADLEHEAKVRQPHQRSWGKQVGHEGSPRLGER